MTNTTTTTFPHEILTSSPRVERALENALGLGRIWAAHGIEMGRSVLAASAESLSLAISTLDDVKSKLDESAAKATVAPKV